MSVTTSLDEQHHNRVTPLRRSAGRAALVGGLTLGARSKMDRMVERPGTEPVHHAIYLSDDYETDPERTHTILWQPAPRGSPWGRRVPARGGLGRYRLRGHPSPTRTGRLRRRHACGRISRTSHTGSPPTGVSARVRWQRPRTDVDFVAQAGQVAVSARGRANRYVTLELVLHAFDQHAGQVRQDDPIDSVSVRAA